MPSALEAAVSDALDAQVVAVEPVSGGDVARSFRITLGDGRRVFAKAHHDPPPGFFVTEANGLRWLRDARTLPVPEVLAVADGGGLGQPGPVAMLVLEWIDEGHGRPSDEAAFGRSLAHLHRAGAPFFGREDRRPTGSRSLPNDPASSWAEFYADRRLGPLVRLARDGAEVDADVLADIERIASRLAEFGAADEDPARLHGDLWAGNRVVDRSGTSWLIDPAAHGGHREFDLAMMRLFGGFGDAAFAAYGEEWPLQPGWRARVPLHQLAPLMVHAIKFGGAYRPAVRRAVEELRGGAG
jgi:fructosamine-3-kinase